MSCRTQRCPKFDWAKDYSEGDLTLVVKMMGLGQGTSLCNMDMLGKGDPLKNNAIIWFVLFKVIFEYFWSILPRDLSILDYHLPYRNNIFRTVDIILPTIKKSCKNLDQWISLPVSPGEPPNNLGAGQQPSCSTSRATANEDTEGELGRWKLCCLKHGTFPEKTNSTSS